MARSAAKPAGSADAALLAALHERCFAPEGGEVWNQQSIAALLGTPGVFAFVAADEDDQPVGLLIGRGAGGEAEIVTIGVLPDQRRAGHGRTLTEAATRQALAMGAQALYLEVAEGNVAALALYGRCGFRRVGRRPGYYRGGAEPADALILRRDLKETDRRPD